MRVGRVLGSRSRSDATTRIPSRGACGSLRPHTARADRAAGACGVRLGRRTDRAPRGLAPGRGEPPGDLRPQARRPGRDPRAVRLDRHAGRRRPRSASCCRGTPRVADRFAILRSLSHTGFCHQQGNQQMFTGHPEQVLKLKPDHPDLMCIAHRIAVRPEPPGADLRRRQPDPLPRLGLPRPGLRAVRRPRRPERAGLQRPRNRPRGPSAGRAASAAAWGSRRGSTGSAARSTTGRSRRRFDAFQRQAFTLLTGPEARRAFDLEPGGPAAPRPLRPEHLGPALPAGPAAGRGGRRARRRPASTARSAAGSATGTTTPSTTTSSTP